ncbi:MAG: hypothetical protein KDA20_13050 [Phycisphaerales bacterium]|nr:hypothetical protein [Phycisphaerales bacterium]
MKALFTLAAVGIMATSALAGGDCTKSSSDCASKCKGEQNVQVVNAAAKEGGCEASCAAKSGAQVVNAAAKDGSCAASCQSGAQVVTAASKDGACAASCADMEAQKAAMMAKAKALNIPMATFKVGDKTTNCPLEARALAMEAGTMPTVTVNGKTYDNPMEGMDAWQAALSDKLASLTAVSYSVDGKQTQCSVEAGKMADSCHKPVITRVANREFSCQDSAKAAALKAIAAADAVPFTMTVGATEYHCPMTAADASRISGEPVVYHVNGADTECQKTAMCILLASRIMATADAIEHVETVADSGA